MQIGIMLNDKEIENIFKVCILSNVQAIDLEKNKIYSFEKVGRHWKVASILSKSEYEFKNRIKRMNTGVIEITITC